MNTKVATIFLVFCAVHGLQAQLWPRPSSIFRPRPSIFSNSLSGARFPNCFLNALNAIAQAQLGMNQVAQDAINQGTPQDIALRCVREQQAFLQEFSENLTDRVNQISNGVAQTEGLEDIAPELTAELENLSFTISSTPGKAAELLDKGDMKEAAAVFQAARDQVTVHVNKLKDIVEERFGKDSEYFQEADKLGNEILYTGYTNAQKLIANVQQCIKDRTPA